MLSVSYIISGMFLLALNLITKDDSAKPSDVIVLNEVNEDIIKVESEENVHETERKQANLDLIELTKTERKIYDYYIKGMLAAWGEGLLHAPSATKSKARRARKAD